MVCCLFSACEDCGVDGFLPGAMVRYWICTAHACEAAIDDLRIGECRVASRVGDVQPLRRESCWNALDNAGEALYAFTRRSVLEHALQLSSEAALSVLTTTCI